MANIGRDSLLAKKLLTGLLAAAGSGVAIYFGYKKWRSRSEGRQLPDGSSGQETASDEKKAEEIKSENDADEVVKSDPTPVLQPEPVSSSNTSPTHDPESLSVSGTFEKVSLSAFQEKAHESEDTAVHSPSESFEKVSLPSINNETPDLHSQVPSRMSHVTTPSRAGDPVVSSPKASSSPSADVKQEVSKPEVKPEARSFASVQPSKPSGPTSATRVTPSSADPEPTSRVQQAVEIPSDLSTRDAGKRQEHKDGEDAEVSEDEKDDEDADEDEDEDEEGSSSDASADSQVKDGVEQEIQKTEQSETTAMCPGVVTSESPASNINSSTESPNSARQSGFSSSQNIKPDSVRYPDDQDSRKTNSGSVVESLEIARTSQKLHTPLEPRKPSAQTNNVPSATSPEKRANSQTASDPERTSGSPGNGTHVLYKRRISATSLTDAENVNMTKERLHRCMNQTGSGTRDGHVFIGHPVQRDKCLDFGMKLEAERHVVLWLDSDGLARECGVSVGDQLLTVNGMSVTGWKSDVLLKLLAIINATKFELTLSPSDQILKSKGLIRQITVNLILDNNTVKVKPIVTDMTSDCHVMTPPIELDVFTPKCCFVGKPDTDMCLMLRGSEIVMARKTDDIGPFEMMRLLFTRKNVKGYKPPVTMLAFCHNDVISYICTTDRNTLGLMRQADLQTNVNSLDVADCRFFSHKFVAGFDCFESTQFPDHYLSCEGEHISLKYINNSKEVNQHRSVHFKLHYKPVS